MESAGHLVIVPHTHWDREWYRTHDQFRHRLVTMLDGLLDLLEGDPDFRHFTLDGQTIVVDDYLAVRPHAAERIAKLVRDGRLLVGPWLVLPDEWLVSGEALIRNLRFGTRRAAELGGAMPLGYVPDPFGHVGQLPQILAGFGLEGAALWRGVGADVDRTLFWWEAPDGTRLLTVYLARGYGHGADLPLDPVALAARLQAELASLAPFATGATQLVMNGGDHQSPQAGLAAALRAAQPRLGALTAEIGTLPGFLRRARQEASGDLPVHRGELRSGLRAPLLPGCASARAPQKRAEFANDRLLLRYLEPLACWLGALGGRADPEWIDFAWRLALENHPHDSVCGCSIDPVHAAMDDRFRRVEQLARAHLDRVGAELTARVAAPRCAPGDCGALVVWNPNAALTTPVEGELELDVPLAGGRRPPPLHLRDASGAAHPLHVEVVEPAACLWRLELPAPAFAALLPGVENEVFGHAVHDVAVVRRDARLHVTVRVGSAPASGFDAPRARRSVEEVLAQPGIERVALEIRRPPRLRLRFVAALPAHGLRSYRVARGARAGRDELRAERLPRGGAAIENAAWRIEADRDGRFTLRSRRPDLTIPDALRLVSEGDRGDLYDFDPVPDGERVERPQRGRVRARRRPGVEATLVLAARYRLPRELAPDRRRRSRRHVTLPVRLELRLARGTDRIDVRVEVDNRARDHRLRLHLRAPFAARRFQVESAFEIVERPIAPSPEAFGPGLAAERPSGAVPQRSFASLDDGELACTVANRGVSEVEAVPEPDGATSLALTVLRAVGWLSRDDLATRPSPAGPPLATPGAQVPGRHVAELSLRLHRAGEPLRVAQAYGFSAPPLLLAGGGGRGAELPDGARLVELDDPEVVVSALEPRGLGSGVLRLCNLSPRERRVCVRWPGGGEALEAVDLAERPLPDAPLVPRAEGGVELRMGAWQVVGLRPR